MEEASKAREMGSTLKVIRSESSSQGTGREPDLGGKPWGERHIHHDKRRVKTYLRRVQSFDAHLIPAVCPSFLREAKDVCAHRSFPSIPLQRRL